MTTQDIIDHLKAGRPLTKNVAKEIIRELERVKALAEAVRPIVRYYDWIVSDEDGIDLDDVIIGSTAHPHFTGKDLETIKRLCEVRK